MNQEFMQDRVKTIYVLPQLAGIHLDYSLGEELPLFAPLATDKLVYGVGYNSSERRRALSLTVHETTSPVYRRWLDMLTRCYKSRAAAYEGCTVCRKWLDFQEFADWFVAQTYSGAEDAELDKDILDPINKIYSPEYCSVVPRVINQMFRDTRSQRGNLPIGVSVAARGKGFISRISKHGKHFYLGKFNDPIAAFEAYKAAHSEYCVELAATYEGKIDQRVIRRLETYSRHIRD